MKRLLLTLLATLLTTVWVAAQNSEFKLAQQYYNNGEFEKAVVIFEKLQKQNTHSDFFFSKYLDCLIQLEEYDKAERSLKKRIRQFPKKGQLHVEYGNLYEKQLNTEAADEEYRKAIKLLEPKQNEIIRLASAFTGLTKYELAVETYEKGNRLLKKPYLFSYQIGDVYRRKGDLAKMIEHYLNSLMESKLRLSSIQTYFQTYLSDEDLAELKRQLYGRIQQSPDAVVYPEMLIWLFIQDKDFGNALRQAKALDKRFRENGSRLYKLAQDAKGEKDYKAAINAYDYIINDKGKSCSYYYEARGQRLATKQQQLTESFDYTEEDLRSLEQEYYVFLDEFGRHKTTAPVINELARLEAFYLHDLDIAITLLDELINYPGVDHHTQARSKLDLGDFYLIQGEIWESTLLYSQVDKAFKDDILGDEARFKNARLAYYNYDFEWSQAQLKVLKASTSELIANDAIDLSVFIMDNYGLDTTASPMRFYAAADLLIFQNRFEEAFTKLDSIRSIWANHELEDDIYYAKSRIYLKQRQYTEAADMLQRIIDEHAEGIRADNALFELASLCETHLDDLDKAKELYGRILKEYSGSTFAVEARKRFRKLRGDKVQ